MNKPPKISIVTPSFNQDEFLESTIQSIVSQKYPNLEYIIIDGGSNDGSVDIIKKYESEVSYWISEKDGGHGAGLNKGFAKSTGEIMGWLNSDDMLTPWSLKTVGEIFQLFPNVNWIQGFTSSWNRKGQMINADRNPKNIYDYLTGNYAWIQQESVFWRRSLWEKAGGHISGNVKFMVDGELWTRFFLHDNLYMLDCVLGGWRNYGGNRATVNHQKCLEEMDEAIALMSANAPSPVLNRAKRLKAWLSLTELPLLKSLAGKRTIEKILSRTVDRRLFKETGYNLIAWDIDNNCWTESYLPFR